jgi:predicted small metal-binding protein
VASSQGGIEVMKLIKCSCGKIVRGETDEELLANADEHIRNDHPDLVGKIAHEDLLAMAEPA